MDLERTIKKIEPQDGQWRARAKERLDQLTMPHWALGRLMDLSMDLAGITRSMQPPVRRRSVVVMAGDHGVADEGVSCYPKDVTAQMVYNFVARGAGINALGESSGTGVVVVDMGVATDLSGLAEAGKIISKKIAPGTACMTKGPTMTREQATQALEAGIAVAYELGEQNDVLATGEMGIANTTPSSAIVSVLCGKPVADVTGRGTGIGDDSHKNKVAVIERAISLNAPDANDPLDVLAKVGGFEIGGLAGLILGAAAQRKPVVIDGFISTAAALIAHAFEPKAADYMVAAHQSVECGHRAALEKLGKRPLLDLDLRLGEGTGAAIAMHLLDAAVSILTRVATFEEASVSQATS